jgi:hypothetical protein
MKITAVVLLLVAVAGADAQTQEQQDAALRAVDTFFAAHPDCKPFSDSMADLMESYAAADLEQACELAKRITQEQKDKQP